MATSISRLLMIAGDFPPDISGVGDYAFHVSHALAALGVGVTVLTSVSDAQANAQVGNNSIDLDRSIVSWKLSTLPLILNALDRAGPGTVVDIQYNCLAYGRSALVTLLPALLRIARPRAHVVVTMHGFWEQSKLFKLRSVPMLRAAHGIIFVDRKNEKPLSRYGGQCAHRLKYIPIAGNIPPLSCTPEERSTWRTALGFAEGDIVIAFFGGVSLGKGIEYLLRAIHALRASGSRSIKLLLIGGFAADGVNETYHPRIKACIASLDASPWVTICDFPPPQEVSRALHSADLAVFPFLRGVGENSGSMLAALAHGLPTVVTSGPANSARMEERFGVVRVRPGEVEPLVHAISSLIADAPLRERMRRTGLAYVREHDWPAIAKETRSFLAGLD